MHVVDDATIAAFRNLPFQFQLKIAVFFIGYQIANSSLGQVNGTIIDRPFFGYGLSGFLIYMPPFKVFSVEQRFPFAFFRQPVRLNINRERESQLARS